MFVPLVFYHLVADATEELLLLFFGQLVKEARQGSRLVLGPLLFAKHGTTSRASSTRVRATSYRYVILLIDFLRSNVGSHRFHAHGRLCFVLDHAGLLKFAIVHPADDSEGSLTRMKRAGSSCRSHLLCFVNIDVLQPVQPLAHVVEDLLIFCGQLIHLRVKWLYDVFFDFLEAFVHETLSFKSLLDLVIHGFGDAVLKTKQFQVLLVN